VLLLRRDRGRYADVVVVIVAVVAVVLLVVGRIVTNLVDSGLAPVWSLGFRV
jgi:hypothetical protein